MVSRFHIDALVQIALYGCTESLSSQSWYPPFVAGEKITKERANELGALLAAANLASIQHRYPHIVANPERTPRRDDELPGNAYKFPKVGHVARMRKAVDCLSALACYEYQASEYPQWEESDAHKFCIALRDRLCGHLPGFEQGPWAIDEPLQPAFP